ncbi:MAG: DUF2922 domain-containing protein [Syntrophomonadaceae bacterium]|nr:DUF2922 domain-containing protein [Syntrophomonadaceae bacterium]
MPINKYELDFNTTGDRIFKIIINDANTTLAPDDVSDVMDIVVDRNCFAASTGDLTDRKAARLVTTTVLELPAA